MKLQTTSLILGYTSGKITITKWSSFTWAASEVMLPVLRCWPVISEVDVGGTTVDAEHSHQWYHCSPWSSDMWIPHWRTSSRWGPQWLKWYTLYFGIGNVWSFWISINLDKLSTLAAILQFWLTWRIEIPELGQRRTQPFTCYVIMSGPIPVWRL